MDAANRHRAFEIIQGRSELYGVEGYRRGVVDNKYLDKGLFAALQPQFIHIQVNSAQTRDDRGTVLKQTTLGAA